MRVLTDPAETGAVCLALPEDVQTEVVEVPAAFLEERTWTIYRRPPAPEALARAAELVRAAKRPLLVAGGGVVYAEATGALREFAEATGIPVAETQAGRGALPSAHPSALGAVGATGTPAANRLAREADLVIGVGTRWSDFTTASKSAFQDPGVRFVNVNVAALDAAKHSGLALEADARLALDALREALAGHRADPEWERRAATEAAAWDAEVRRLYSAGHGPLPSQAEVIGAVNAAAGERDVVVCAAGSMPGDLHKLWRATDPDGKGYHVEYGYSCMGYEIPGGMGVKLAAPDREVFVMVGDGSYLMLPGELATAVAEGIKLVIVLVQNHGYASIGALSRSVGGAGYGTHYRVAENGNLPVDAPAAPAGNDPVPVDLATNAESLGARVLRTRTIAELREALARRKAHAGGPVVVYVETDRYAGVPSYESWWDVPVAEVGGDESVRAARAAYEETRSASRRDGTYERPRRRIRVGRHAGVGRLGVRGLRAAAARAGRGGRARHRRPRVLHRRDRRARRHRLGARRLARVGERATPFAGAPDAAYLPPGTRFTITGEAELGLCFAPAARRRRAARATRDRRRPRDARPRRPRAHDPPDPDGGEPADSLLVCEVHTPPGHWSSYPPHKHDRDAMPEESFLEETYYFRIDPPRGFGLQRVYTADRSLDETLSVRDRDTVLVPRGYHTVSAPPGYAVYYLNVMAGPTRAWAVANDPDHEWTLAP